MVAALFDTNILIDYLRGLEAARKELLLYRSRSISIVTWMEVMAGAPSEHEVATRAFLSEFSIFQLDELLAERAVVLRKRYRVKLPDAVIWATADVNRLLLVIRDRKDFPAELPGIRHPYNVG